MKVYIAAALACAPVAAELAALLAGNGHRVVSSWHVGQTATVDPEDEYARSGTLRHNLCELRACDVAVVLAHLGEPRATFSEVGYALALDKRVVWLHAPSGAGRNIFDAHGLVRRFAVHSEPLGMVVLDALAEPKARA